MCSVNFLLCLVYLIILSILHRKRTFTCPQNVSYQLWSMDEPPNLMTGIHTYMRTYKHTNI